jgi:hypothetical protein
MRQPPPAVWQVVETLAALFGLSEERWATLKRRLDAGLLSRMAALDAIAASRLPRNKVERFQRHLHDHPAFADRALHEKCPAVGPLQKYCLAVGQLLLRLHGDTLSVEPPPAGHPSDSAEWGSAVSVRDDSAFGAQAVQRTASGTSAPGEKAAKPSSSGAKVSTEASKEGQLLSTSGWEPVEEAKAIFRSPDASGGPSLAEPLLSNRLAEPLLSNREVPAPPTRSVPSGQGAGAGTPTFPGAGTPAAPAPTNNEPDLAGLIVQPELWKLSEAELMNVRELKISRKGVGSVVFHGETDCRGLLSQLHELLVIEQGEVVVYPETRWKPPVGQGLNKPASVALYGCMPKSQQRLADPKARDRYRQRVAVMTEEKGAVFEDYNCEDGTWKFRVNHF